MNSASLHIAFAPYLPDQWIWALTCIAALIALLAIRNGARGTFSRTLAGALLIGSLLNPSLIAEEHEALRDTALLVIDDSASMKIADRAIQSQNAEAALMRKLSALSDLDVQAIHVKGGEETDLFRAIDDKLNDLPKNRIAGIIAVTDGEVHDQPAKPYTAPFHAIIAGHHNESDRRIEIKSAPAYGIVGHSITVTLRVTDEPVSEGTPIPVTYQAGDGSAGTISVPPGKDVPFTVPVTHAGPNLFVFSAATTANELTTLNNMSAITVNGIRDRLRVLLVSGQPHIGGRVWRNFLKSDPAVDLVHFTILRSPGSQDGVPENELALIAFPVRELFEMKLKSFDLIIFDRFKNQLLIPDLYLENIAKYVKDGGALLLSNSTETGVPSLTRSPLASVLPAQPTGDLLTGNFVPALTDAGARHPVTDALPAAMPQAKWGPWFRQIGASVNKGDVLMTGLRQQPLLVLAHEGEGRVAEFLSDQFWLWSRGGNVGERRHAGAQSETGVTAGPQAELLRRTVHWLMGEPELDENALRAHAENGDNGWQLTITRQSLHDDSDAVTITDPKGATSTATLAKGAHPGILSATVPVPTPGLYHIKDKDQETLVMAGPQNAPEFGRMIATADIVKPAVTQSGGDISWLEDHAEGPDLRRTDRTAAQSGWNWIGLRRNGQYRVTGSKAYPLLPPWAAIIVLLGTAMLAWRREGKG
jgi:hypothetical protein